MKIRNPASDKATHPRWKIPPASAAALLLGAGLALGLLACGGGRKGAEKTPGNALDTAMTTAGQIVAAAIGSEGGAAVSRRMDSVAAEITALSLPCKLERLGEGIKMTCPAALFFSAREAALKPEALPLSDTLGGILARHPGATVFIQGHTAANSAMPDAATETAAGGSDRRALRAFSRERAEALAGVFEKKGVERKRFLLDGQGPDQPIADNAAPEGRSQNERIEIGLHAGPEMQRAARKGDL